MDTMSIIGAVVLLLVIVGAILGPIFAGRRRTERFQSEFGGEYNRTVGATGSDNKAQTELDARKKHVESLNIRPLSASERQHYQADWAAVQAKFVDQPGQATIEADHLIMEVMQLRDYPVSDFEQRAADVSVNYPALVTNYRAAHEVAILNEQHHAGTEDLRKAMINYRSLFDELLGADTPTLATASR
jgi:hypothetical protein